MNDEVKTEVENNDITLNDLSIVRSIIDLASTRGAFKASEMSAVGKTYDKLSAFLAAVAEKQAVSQPQEG
jgi:hypothetical protein